MKWKRKHWLLKKWVDHCASIAGSSDHSSWEGML